MPLGLESAWAAEDVLERHGVPGPRERYEAADRALGELQSSTLRSMMGEFEPRVVEPALVAAEVAFDYRCLNAQILSRPEYHLPQTYVDLLVSGELPSVHVRTVARNGGPGDFRTPSSTPPSHVGGARAASEASQQMRLLLEGRGAAMEFAGHVAELQGRWIERAGNPRRNSGPLRLIELLPSQPIINVKTAAQLLGGTEERARQAVLRLEQAEVLRQTAVGRRNRAWECVGLFDLLDRFERELGPPERVPRPTR